MSVVHGWGGKLGSWALLARPVVDGNAGSGRDVHDRLECSALLVEYGLPVLVEQDMDRPPIGREYRVAVTVDEILAKDSALKGLAQPAARGGESG